MEEEVLLLRKKRKGTEPHQHHHHHHHQEAEGDKPSSSSSTTTYSDKTPHLLPSSSKSQSNIGSHLSLEASFTRRRKKCKEIGGAVVVDDVDASHLGTIKTRLPGVVTAPPCGSSLSEHACRGIKRKIGCIDVATKLGRKKKIHKDYVLEDEIIGKGRFGSVRLCKSTANGAQFACKTLCKGEETVHREVEIMQHLSGHPGVVTLQAVYEDAHSFHLVMELCSGGRLVDQMIKEGRFSEPRAATILHELMLVIKYCHEMGVVHRDIKPENILLTASGCMKLADFGLATRVSNGQSLSGTAGSPAYVAPEVLMGNYSEKVDVWSAGVLLHALLIGSLPFQGDSLEAVFEAIKKVNLNLNGGVWESVTAPARDLISRMLTRDVSSRLTAEEVLRHPWILFHSEHLKTTFVKSIGTNDVGGQSCQLRFGTGVESERKRVASFPLNDGSGRSSRRFCTELEEEDDCSLVDALAVAISRVRISEPKRSRICAPSNPVEQECSSNVKVNNLCTAF